MLVGVRSPLSLLLLFLALSTDGNPTASVAESLQLSGHQCSLGNNLSIPSIGSQDPGKLYVEFGKVAPCSGTVTRWEVCFVRSGPMPTRSIHFVVLRLNKNQTSYSVANAREITLMRTDLGEQCDYIDGVRENEIVVEEGDLFGFANGVNGRVALGDTRQSVNNTLRVYNFGHNSVAESLGINITIARDAFEEITQQLAPLIRVTINSTFSADEGTQPPVLPWTDHPHSSCGCPDGNTLGDSGPQSSELFVSVTSAAGIVILVLCVLVVFLACCLCQRQGYTFSHSCCQKQSKVTHTIRVEPLFEQSMLYNDLYVPSEQHEGGSRREKRKTNLQDNPAYLQGQVGAHAESNMQGDNFSEVQTTKWSQANRMQVDTTPGDLEHTYEVVRSIKLS